uniref:F-box associated domain-containing protein n=1 Tax=Lactuca sativa TaxID=4236 RepID=A0A9R1VF99_LACSA|nr:hypothetical protein LSAT_V11C500278720 [Lactuca sativa]
METRGITSMLLFSLQESDLEEEIVSPAKLTNAYKDSTIGTMDTLHISLMSDTIVAFDLGSKTFRVILLPHPTYGRSKSLRVLDKKHCVILMDVFDVVMDEYEVVESSFMNGHVFSQFIDDDTYPFEFTLHDEFLAKNTYNCHVFYDPIANEVKMLENDCSYGEYGKDKIVEYVDCLVWVARALPEMVDDAGQNLTKNF